MVSTKTFSVEGILHLYLKYWNLTPLECLRVSAPFVSLLTMHVQ